MHDKEPFHVRDIGIDFEELGLPKLLILSFQFLYVCIFVHHPVFVDVADGFNTIDDYFFSDVDVSFGAF
jgi:hypothetical protein